jgi:hypothetical protein
LSRAVAASTWEVYLRWFATSIVVSILLFGLSSAVLLGMQGGLASALAVGAISAAQWAIVTLVTLPAMLIPFAAWFALARVAPQVAASRATFVGVEAVLSIVVMLARFVFEAHSLHSLRWGEIFNAYYLRTWITLVASIVASCLMASSIRQRLLTSRVDDSRG